MIGAFIDALIVIVLPASAGIVVGLAICKLLGLLP